MLLVIRQSTYTISTSDPHQKMQRAVLANRVVEANQPTHHPHQSDDMFSFTSISMYIHLYSYIYICMHAACVITYPHQMWDHAFDPRQCTHTHASSHVRPHTHSTHWKGLTFLVQAKPTKGGGNANILIVKTGKDRKDYYR